MWIFFFFQMWLALAAGAEDSCNTDASEEPLVSWAETLAFTTGQLMTAGKVCSETLAGYKEAGCKVQDIRGLFSPQNNGTGGGKSPEAEASQTLLPKRPPPQIPGGYLRKIEGCGKDFRAVRTASVAYIRKPAMAGNIPRTDSCVERNDSPPNYYQKTTKTVTKRDPKDYSKMKTFSVIEDFAYDPSAGARLRMVSVAGDEIQCYGGEFDPNKKEEVAYLYCVHQGKKISVPRKDQFAVISNGRFSVSDALRLPEPPNFQNDPNWKMRPEQKIP